MKIRYNFYILILIILCNSCSKKTKNTETIAEKVPLTNILPNKDDIVYKGNIEFSTQSEIDSFKKGGYTFIDGNVIISSLNYKDNYIIENVNSFNKIRSINGDLEVIHLENLRSLKGFDNLEIINGTFTFSSNYNDEEESFKNLKKINGDIYLYPRKKSFKSLNLIKTAKKIYIGIESKNNTIFNNLKSAKEIYCSYPSVDSIICFPNLQKVETNIIFEFSPDLKYLEFPNLEQVGGFFGLNDVPNLEKFNIPNLKKINNLLIFLDNDNWKRYCFISKYIKKNKIDTLDIRGTLLNIDKKNFIKECEK